MDVFGEPQRLGQCSGINSRCAQSPQAWLHACTPQLRTRHVLGALGLVVADAEAGLEDAQHVLMAQQPPARAAHACQQHLQQHMTGRGGSRVLCRRGQEDRQAHGLRL